MRKFAIIAFAFVLSGALLAGCRGGSTDMTTTPTDSTPGTTQNGSVVPSQSGTSDRNNDGMRGENSHNRIDPQRNF